MMAVQILYRPVLSRVSCAPLNRSEDIVVIRYQSPSWSVDREMVHWQSSQNVLHVLEKEDRRRAIQSR
jgi:hypothetical protein